MSQFLGELVLMVMEGLELVIPANRGSGGTPLIVLAMGHLWGWAAPRTELWGAGGALCALVGQEMR